MKRSRIVLTAVLTIVMVLVIGSISSDAAEVKAKQSISKCKITLSKTEFTAKYNWTEELMVRKPKVTVKKGTKTLKKGRDYKLIFSNKRSKNAGTYYVKVKGIGKYKGTVKRKYRIKKIDLAGADMVQLDYSGKGAGVFYTGKARTPKTMSVDHVAHIGGSRTMIPIKEGRDYTVVKAMTYDNNVEAGLGYAYMTVKGKGNFKGTVEASGSFMIFPQKSNVTSLTAGTKQLTVEWSKAKYADGYLIDVYGEKGEKSHYKDYIKVDSPDKLVKTITGLRSGYTYQVKVYSFFYFAGDEREFYKPHDDYRSVKVK